MTQNFLSESQNMSHRIYTVLIAGKIIFEKLVKELFQNIGEEKQSYLRQIHSHIYIGQFFYSRAAVFKRSNSCFSRINSTACDNHCIKKPIIP